MSDWIKRRKEQIEASETQTATREELRLLKAKIIRAKLPDFFKVLTEQVINDGKELSEINADHRCTVEDFGGGFAFSNETLPKIRVMVQLNLDGQSLDVRQTILLSPTGMPKTQSPDHISIDVDEQNNLLLEYQGRKYMIASDLSEALYKRIFS